MYEKYATKVLYERYLHIEFEKIRNGEKYDTYECASNINSACVKKAD